MMMYDHNRWPILINQTPSTQTKWDHIFILLQRFCFLFGFDLGGRGGHWWWRCFLFFQLKEAGLRVTCHILVGVSTAGLACCWWLKRTTLLLLLVGLATRWKLLSAWTAFDTHPRPQSRKQQLKWESTCEFLFRSTFLSGIFSESYLLLLGTSNYFIQVQVNANYICTLASNSLWGARWWAFPFW